MSRASPEGRSRRRLYIALAVVIGLVAVLVVFDRVANAYAEKRVASQIQQRGFSGTPHVTIEGFPFLTQLAAHDFREVVITATGTRAGPLEVSRISATLHQVKVNGSFSGATVTTLNGTALVGFGGIAQAAGAPGLRVTSDGHGQLKIIVDLGLISGTATAQVTRAGPDKIHVKVVSLDGIPASALGDLQEVTLPLPALPMGLSLQSVSVSDHGVLLRITGHNVALNG